MLYFLKTQSIRPKLNVALLYYKRRSISCKELLGLNDKWWVMHLCFFEQMLLDLATSWTRSKHSTTLLGNNKVVGSDISF